MSSHSSSDCMAWERGYIRSHSSCINMFYINPIKNIAVSLFFFNQCRLRFIFFMVLAYHKYIVNATRVLIKCYFISGCIHNVASGVQVFKIPTRMGSTIYL